MPSGAWELVSVYGIVVGKECRVGGEWVYFCERGWVAHVKCVGRVAVLRGWVRCVGNSSGVVVRCVSLGGVLVGWVYVGGAKVRWVSE